MRSIATGNNTHSYTGIRNTARLVRKIPLPSHNKVKTPALDTGRTAVELEDGQVLVAGRSLGRC